MRIPQPKSVFQTLYDHEINFEVRTFYKAGFEWKLGDCCSGWKSGGSASSESEMFTQLWKSALKHYPHILKGEEDGSEE